MNFRSKPSDLLERGLTSPAMTQKKLFKERKIAEGTSISPAQWRKLQGVKKRQNKNKKKDLSHGGAAAALLQGKRILLDKVSGSIFGENCDTAAKCSCYECRKERWEKRKKFSPSVPAVTSVGIVTGRVGSQNIIRS